GQLLKSRDGLVLHDCSTLGGNSGSPIVRLETGEVVGLHFSGLFLQENRGVPAAQLAEILDKVRGKVVVPVTDPVPDHPPDSDRTTGGRRDVVGKAGAAARSGAATTDGRHTIRIALNVPIEVSVQVGTIRVLGSPGMMAADGGDAATIDE